MNYRAWQVNRPDEGKAKRLAQGIGASMLLARTLVARGYDTPEKAAAFLIESAPLSDPFLIKDMDKAVQRILRALDEEEPIAVFGDYDVDGVTATALLFEHLRSMGADVRCMLPSREGDGYGLSRPMLEKLAAKGYRLVITVDNGISAVQEATYAKELGLDLIITDHHLASLPLPEAVAVVDPNRPDDESPFKSLCGAGVAFKLCAALDGCEPEDLLDFCGDLAAIGTVADVMPLVGENRTLVRAGLENLQNTERPGLVALIEAAGMAEKPVTAESISFTLAPRLNAAGRMDSAVLALQLLLCEDPGRAEELAAELCRCNTSRQEAEQQIMAQVEAQLAAEPARRNDRVIVLWGDYHPGVTGIVASRVVEAYGRPAILISLQNGEGKGSGRSIQGFHLHKAIAACEDLLIRYGGHALAAGLSIRKEALEEFRTRINAWAAQEYPVMQLPPLRLDVPVKLNELTVEGVKELDYLAPCGGGNPAPVFLLENAVVDGVYPVGDKRHSRIRLRQGDQCIYAAYFGMSPAKLAYSVGDHVDAALSLSVYEGGRGGAQLSGRIKELRPAGLPDEAVEQAALFESFRAGAKLTQQQRQLLLPKREDTVALYRTVQAGGVPTGDLRPMFAKLGPQNTGKFLVSLAALCQLGLVAPKEMHGSTRFAPLPAKGKKDLTSAPILRALEV